MQFIVACCPPETTNPQQSTSIISEQSKPDIKLVESPTQIVIEDRSSSFQLSEVQTDGRLSSEHIIPPVIEELLYGKIADVADVGGSDEKLEKDFLTIAPKLVSLSDEDSLESTNTIDNDKSSPSSFGNIAINDTSSIISTEKSICTSPSLWYYFFNTSPYSNPSLTTQIMSVIDDDCGSIQENNNGIITTTTQDVIKDDAKIIKFPPTQLLSNHGKTGKNEITFTQDVVNNDEISNSKAPSAAPSASPSKAPSEVSW